MITGATGSGKSSTINALFNTEVAKVGVGVDPETMDITKYDLDNLVLWDSPGLGVARRQITAMPIILSTSSKKKMRTATSLSIWCLLSSMAAPGILGHLTS